ncbi:MAG: gamma-glutamylcyclotransferase [Alphaproteobacteria bacterium]
MAPHDDAPPILSRDRIRNGAIATMLHEAERLGLITIASDKDRQQSRDQILSQAEPAADIWVFGYGSLMWNPAFEYAERRVATLHGYHRRYCLRVHAGRATVDKPGLILALEPGGSCIGEAFRIPRKRAETELDIIWAREMVAMSYRPRWVRLNSTTRPFRAITFTAQRSEPRYTGRLPNDHVADTLAQASGPLGTSVDYLEKTVAHLAGIGINDRHLSALLAKIRQAG